MVKEEKKAVKKAEVSPEDNRKIKEALLARAKKRACYSPKFKKLAAKLEAELNPTKKEN